MLIGVVVAVLLSAGSAPASAAEPYVIYTANTFVNGAVVLRYEPATGALVEISRNGAQGNLFQRPYDLAIEADGSLLIADMGVQNQKDGAVIRVDPLSGRQSLVSSGGWFYDPTAIAVAPNGQLYVVDSASGDNGGSVIRVDPSSGAQELVSSDFNPDHLFDLAFGIAIDRDGTLIVVNRSIGDELPAGCGLAGSVMRVNPATHEQELIPFLGAGLFAFPVGVAVAGDGSIVVANECEGPLRAGLVRLVPGQAQVALTSNDTSDVLRTPERVAITPAGDMLVTDFNAGSDDDGGIVKVSPGGAQSVLSSGPLFNRPMGIAVVRNRPPTAALSAAPSEVAAGRQVRLDASGSRDPEGLRLVYEWDLDGDGSFEAGSGSTPAAAPRFVTDGPKTVRVRANDPHGGRAVAQADVRVDGSTPLITRLRVARALGLRSRRSAAALPAATQLRFRLSEAATVTVALHRARAGHRRKGRPCSPRAKRGRRCTLYTRARTIRRSRPAGENAITLRSRGLKPGRYRITVIAVDGVGNRSAPRRLGIRVVRQP
jgi:PKD domain